MRQPTASSRELPQKCRRGRARMLLWYIFLSLGAVGHLLFGEAQAKELLKWCVVGDEEWGVCTQLIKYLNQQDDSEWKCYKASSVGDCITAVQDRDADFVTLDPGKAYLGYKYHGLFPVVSLTTGNSNTQSNAVAVVKADFCGNASLKDKVSCHSGYRELAGWYAPVGKLLNNATIPQVDDGNDVKSVEEYFTRSCAPGDEPGSGICSACSSSSCSDAEDAYAGDSGAISCLMNGGDVAFVRESSVLQYLNQTNSQQGSANITKDNFRNLCWNLTCQALDDPDTCVWLTIPNDLIMTRIGLADTIREKTVSVLEDLSRMGEFQAEFFSPSKNPKGLIFQLGVTGMVPVTSNLETLLGRDVLQAIAAVHRLDLPSGGLGAANGSTELPNVKWCAVGEKEFELCNQFIIQLNNQSWMTWSCIMQDNVQDCLLDVQNGTADVLSVPADVLFMASHYHGLSAVMSENCSDASSGGYWTVVVVRTEVCNQSQDLRFAALKGKASCHGIGYGDSAGWKSPVATIVNLDLVKIPPSGQKDISAVTEFFSSVCAPGTDDSKLCTGCQSSCTPDNGTTQVDSGAQDCLNSGGDVAFIRSPRNMAPGVFKDIDRERFSLLCPQGGCANMSEVDTCNFFYVPFKAVVVRDSMEKSFINEMTETLATVSKSEKFRALFMEGANSQSLLFSQSLVSLSKIITTTDQYLNTSLDMFATYYELYNPGGVAMASHSARNRDLTIIYGVAIAVVVLISIGLGTFCYIRSKKLKENAVSRRQAMEYTRAEWN